MRTTLAALVAAFAICCAMHSSLVQASDVKSDFEMVEKIGTRKAYEVFLGTYPTGPYADLARKRIQEMDPEGRTRPNWGDEIFIPRLMDRQK